MRPVVGFVRACSLWTQHAALLSEPCYFQKMSQNLTGWVCVFECVCVCVCVCFCRSTSDVFSLRTRLLLVGATRGNDTCQATRTAEDAQQGCVLSAVVCSFDTSFLNFFFFFINIVTFYWHFFFDKQAAGLPTNVAKRLMSPSSRCHSWQISVF